MNQTRILLGVCLALGAAVALLFYQQQKQTQQLLQVVAGKMKPAESDIYNRFNQLLTWADKFRRLGVRATPASRLGR